MRSPHVALGIALGLLFARSCAGSLRDTRFLRMRQDQRLKTTEEVPGSSTSTPVAPSVTPSSTVPSTKTTNNDARKTTSVLTGGDATSVITLVPTTTPTSMPNTTLLGDTRNKHELPIDPRITPALGVAGGLLMISGAALGFVGIRHRMIQIFLSTTLLVALGIEVLIVYLMEPPVSNIVQAGFVIAGAVGGSLIGGLALVFNDLSEGFGCLLGGFCLSMWLLVLRPGGLIHDSVGKIIVIAFLCVSCSCLYISRFTRVYGVIACTSFAGAYAFVLGVDCYSKAGLKEFWMYIWDVNGNVFPLNTDYYPINKKMKVEIAAVIIVTFAGIISQIKIWLIVKEQRANHDARRSEEREKRDDEEVAVGRDVELRAAKDRDIWESQYEGFKKPSVHVTLTNGSITDSGRGSNHDSAYSRNSRLGEKRHSSQLMEIKPHAQEGISVHPQSQSEGNLVLSREKRPISGFPNLSLPNLGDLSLGSSTSPATVASSTSGVYSSATALLSLNSLNMRSAVEEAEWPNKEEDGVASSVAATVADAPDMDALSVQLSRPVSLYLSQTPSETGISPVLNQEQMFEEDDEVLPLPRNSPGLGSHPQQPSMRETPGAMQTTDSHSSIKDVDTASSAQVDLKEHLPKRMSKAASKYRVNEWTKEISRAEPLPIEKVAEHTLDAVQVETSNAAELARAHENNAAPVPPPPPSPLLVPAQPKPAKVKVRRTSKMLELSRAPLTFAAIPIHTHQSQVNTADWSTPLATRESTASYQADSYFGRVGSNPTTLSTLSASPLAEEGSRDVPTPLPIERPISPHPRTNSPRVVGSLAQTGLPRQTLSRSTPNLLDARQEKLCNRLTSTSFIMPPATPTSDIASSASGCRSDDFPAGRSSYTSMSDGARHPLTSEQDHKEDAMTLAKRQALLRQQPIVVQQIPVLAERPRNTQRTSSGYPGNPHRSSSGMLPQKITRMSAGAPPDYAYRKPQGMTKHSVNQQATNWHTWRNSRAMETHARDPYLTSDSQIEMLRAAKIQSATEATMREQQKAAVQKQMDQHMRMGGMHDAHRTALRRMQSQANKMADTKQQQTP